MKESLRPVVVLTGICVVCASLLSFANQSLGPRVEQQTDLYVRGPALARLFDLPAGELLDNKVTVTIDDIAYPIFFRTKDEHVAGLAVETTGRGGYGGDVVLLIGIDLAEDRLLGMEVVSHSETPGLGARIEEEAFRQQWQGLPAMAPVGLQGGNGSIDAISGATVTSRAVVDGTNRIVDLMVSHKDLVLAAIEAGKDMAQEEPEP